MTEHPIILTHVFEATNHKDERIATATVQRRHSVLWVSDVWVHGDHRGQGFGTDLLHAVCDTLGHEALYLHVAPYAGQPLDEATLATWYGRFGFMETTTPGVLHRAGDFAITRIDD